MILHEYPWLKNAHHNLAESYSGGHLGQAYLIHGPAGIGKKPLAHWFASLLLCKTPDALEPCHTCHSCRFFEAQTHPDWQLIEPDKGTIKIDTIRELSLWCTQTAGLSGLRVVVIEQAELMNNAAANALLKTLEEPASSLKMLLVSNDAASLPATIRSRCQQITVSAVDDSQALAYLERSHAQLEDKKIALSACGGSPLLASEFLDSEHFTQFKELGLFLQKLSQHDVDWISYAKTLATQDTAMILNWFATWVRHWTIIQLDNKSYLSEDNNTEKLFMLYDKCIKNKYDLHFNIRAQGLYEAIFVSWIACFRRG